MAVAVNFDLVKALVATGKLGVDIMVRVGFDAAELGLFIGSELLRPVKNCPMWLVVVEVVLGRYIVDRKAGIGKVAVTRERRELAPVSLADLVCLTGHIATAATEMVAEPLERNAFGAKVLAIQGKVEVIPGCTGIRFQFYDAGIKHVRP